MRAWPRLTVISQDPSGFQERDTTVTLRVSRGPETLKVPNVVNEQADTALSDLHALGFEVVLKHVFDDTVAKDLVISQTPAGDATANKGATVTLTISKGPMLVTVPDVLCKTTGKASEILVAAGFKVDYSSSGRVVVDQDPSGGEKVAKGSTVTLTLGKGLVC